MADKIARAPKAPGKSGGIKHTGTMGKIEGPKSTQLNAYNKGKKK